MTKFENTFRYKLIYVFRINDEAHKGLLKIGEATCNTEKSPEELAPCCNTLNVAAKERINQYTVTAGIVYELIYTELAIRKVEKNGKTSIEAFSDHDVHKVLKRSNISVHNFQTDKNPNEWFEINLETTKNAIKAVKENRASLASSEVSAGNDPIIFRPEQEEAIRKTIKQLRTGNQMLWNAKMRFGKTLTALQVAKECGFRHILILTHRPVVSEGWYEDFGKIFYDTDYIFGSKTRGENIENLADTDKKFVYFASMQDLRGSDAVGGRFNKNDEIFLTEWDFVVIDEAHEGTLTKLGQAVINTIKELSKNPKILRLSGTPFNLLDQFREDEIYTWDYVMEQKAKTDWYKNHFGEHNPYETLPELKIYTYNLDKIIPGYIDVEDGAFNFREFFRTWTGNVKKDFKAMPDGVNVGDFVHKGDVNRFLDLLCKEDENSNYPFSTARFRAYFRHSLWMVPGVKEARALSALLKEHTVFGSGAFNIVNVAGSGDEEIASRDALSAVRNAFGDNPDETYSITISCGRLTTGVTVPEWTAVFMLAGTFSTSASSYMQTIFRVQSPANINGKVKESCCVFDFAPDRTLKMVAEAGKLSVKAGSTFSDRKVMGEFLNYCPVISVEGSSMKPYDVEKLLQQLKRAYTDRVVRSGFDDKHIYNDNLLKLDEIELADFDKLKKIVGTSKQTVKVREIDINKQGFTEEEYDKLVIIERKPKRERTPDEIAFLEEKKKKRETAQKAISILRGVSIRIPLLIYGAEVPIESEITVDNFTDIIDESSWNEFMPSGVTKEIYKKFSKYYERDVFVAAGRRIRNMALAADKLSPDERVKKIAELFSMFKNPDKETVLTPWRVVNMHMSDCLGGYCFYNEDFTETIEEPRFVDHGRVTAETFSDTDAHILEINSKTGLYPLYVTYSIYRKRCEEIDPKDLTIEKQYELWQKTVEDNVFVICKTPMAKAITKRTLIGYRRGKINAHAFDDLIMQLKEKPEQFREKVLRGSFWNKETAKMKFDAVVGNPPYQIMDGGNKASAMPIYNIFVDMAKKIKPQYLSMIMPAKWFNGGRGLDLFREHMLNDSSMQILVDFADSQVCFPGVDIAGGICYFLWNNKHSGKCTVKSYNNGSFDEDIRSLNEYETFIRMPKAIPIVNKLKNFSSINYFDSCVSAQRPFGLRTYVKPQDSGDLVLRYNGGKGLYKNNSTIINQDWIPKWKVIMSYLTYDHAGRADKDGKKRIFSTMEILCPNEICTETYLVIYTSNNEVEVKHVLSYMKTKFVRFMVSLVTATQHISKASFRLVPIQDFTENSDIDWSKSVAEIDKQLYKKYNLSEEEIAFIEKMIKPME